MQASQEHDAALAVDMVTGEAARTAPGLIVPARKEVSNTIIDVVINRTVRLQTGAIVEVGRPTAQQAVQSVSHVGPPSHLAG